MFLYHYMKNYPWLLEAGAGAGTKWFCGSTALSMVCSSRRNPHQITQITTWGGGVGRGFRITVLWSRTDFFL